MYMGLAHLLSIAYDRSRGGHFYGCRRALEKTQWMKRDELEELQVRKVKALLRHAYENVPYYHSLFREKGFRPDHFGGLDDLHEIPVMQRSVLDSKRNELIPGNVKESELISCKTSGTTSSPLAFYRSRMEIPWYLASGARGYSWAGYRTGAKVIYLRLFSPHDQLASARQRLQRLIRRWKLLGGYGLSEQSMEEFCRKQRNFQPDFVHGGAGPVNIFASFLLKHPEFTIRPEAVFTYAETLLPHYRGTIEEAFNCKVHDSYGSTEVPNAAYQCGCHEGLHVADENVLFEMEKDGESAAAGEEGKVLLTSLNARGTPFIRYDIGDSGRILDDDCSCGRKLSLFKPVGRSYEYFVHSDGSFTFFRDWKTVFEGLPIEDFQIVQQGIDEIVIKVLKGTGYNEAHTDFIFKHVSFCTSSRVKVRVEFVDTVPLIGLGKVPHFVKLPTEYT